ncbi:checkpoint protein HUS1 [Phlebotomus argentipes]|uniref:checkpoint protein HUS1 n=1 Tax=Phlebotomus argentipes TaxID=94469 RepID=UPI0028930062|nr:checkpoint protein HUS1 [Phlebotomus argentipes]
MKFRAVIRDSLSIKDFFNIVTTLSKCGKDVIFNALPDRLAVAVNVDSPQTALPMWCDLEKTVFFAEYVMDGLSESHNAIILIMKAANLVRVLSGSRNSETSYLKLKLMSKNIACLCLEMEIPSSTSAASRRISHDVPVMVVSRRDWLQYQLPSLPDFEMTVGVPGVRSIGGIIEAMRESSTVMSVQTVRNGTVSFISESPMAKISCHCRNQDVFAQGESEKITCKIESRRLALFLANSQLPCTDMRCSISEGHLVKFEVKVQDKVIMTCVIPATTE